MWPGCSVAEYSCSVVNNHDGWLWVWARGARTSWHQNSHWGSPGSVQSISALCFIFRLGGAEWSENFCLSFECQVVLYWSCTKCVCGVWTGSSSSFQEDTSFPDPWGNLSEQSNCTAGHLWDLAHSWEKLPALDALWTIWKSNLSDEEIDSFTAGYVLWWYEWVWVFLLGTCFRASQRLNT